MTLKVGACIGGPPPPDHPRRCQCKNRKRDRCRKWACVGSKYCKTHGRRGRYARIKKLPRFYAKELTATLQEYVEASLGTPSYEQLNLFEELALMRATASEAVKLFSAAQKSKNQETRVQAAMLVQEALKHVVTTCEIAARVDAAGKDKISVHSVEQVVQQIVRIAYEIFKNENEVRAFEKEIRTHVRIVGGTVGTSSTPDIDVSNMDDTVPGKLPHLEGEDEDDSSGSDDEDDASSSEDAALTEDDLSEEQ